MTLTNIIPCWSHSSSIFSIAFKIFPDTESPLLSDQKYLNISRQVRNIFLQNRTAASVCWPYISLLPISPFAILSRMLAFTSSMSSPSNCLLTHFRSSLSLLTSPRNRKKYFCSKILRSLFEASQLST